MSICVDIEKRLGSFCLRVKFEADDKTTALLGASGCGKSMTLKCIAGIEKPDWGRIAVDDRVLFDSEKKINLPPQQRYVGLLFQNYALFPHMTVLQNVRTGARRERDRKKRGAAVEIVMERFGLSSLAGHLPQQLSGGQQQRVALARILVSNPRVLLLDEPFSALDSHLRFQMEQEVRRMTGEFGKTVLLVSHDRDEVFRMADSIAVMAHGRIETVGSKRAVFADPETRAGAILTGCKNISAVRHIDEETVYAVDWGIRLTVPNLTKEITAVGIRMRHIREGGGVNSFRCRVVSEIEDPFYCTLMLRPVNAGPGCPLGWLLEKERRLQIRSDAVEVCLPPESILLLRDSEREGEMV